MPVHIISTMILVAWCALFRLRPPNCWPLIITNQVPLLNVLAVLDVTTDATGQLSAVEVGRMTSDTILYQSPVFSPDGLLYAVRVDTFAPPIAETADLGTDTRTRQKTMIELRGVSSVNAVREIAVDPALATTITLHSWTQE